jgi:hypothetical protein
MVVIVGPGVGVTVGDALGRGVGSRGEAPRAVEASPAVITRLNRTDAPRRATRNDFMSLLVFSGYDDGLTLAAARAPRPQPILLAAGTEPVSRRRSEVTLYARPLDTSPAQISVVDPSLHCAGRPRIRSEHQKDPPLEVGL